jgi:hypothetical protein
VEKLLISDLGFTHVQYFDGAIRLSFAFKAKPPGKEKCSNPGDVSNLGN